MDFLIFYRNNRDLKLEKLKNDVLNFSHLGFLIGI